MQIIVQTVAAEKHLQAAADHTIRRLLRRTEELFLRPAVGLENQKKSNLRAGDPGKDPAASLRRIRFPDPCCCLPTPSGQPNSSTQNRSSSNTRPLAIGSLSCCSGEISPRRACPKIACFSRLSCWALYSGRSRICRIMVPISPVWRSSSEGAFSGANRFSSVWTG